jgi:hypothetical protein
MSLVHKGNTECEPSAPGPAPRTGTGGRPPAHPAEQVVTDQEVALLEP